MDPDRVSKTEAAGHRRDEVARAGDDSRAAMTSPLNSALDEAQERQVEQEEADVPAEDRIGDGARRSASNGTRCCHSRTVSQLPADGTGDAERGEDGDDDDHHPPERHGIREVARGRR